MTLARRECWVVMLTDDLTGKLELNSRKSIGVWPHQQIMTVILVASDCRLAKLHVTLHLLLFLLFQEGERGKRDRSAVSKGNTFSLGPTKDALESASSTRLLSLFGGHF